MLPRSWRTPMQPAGPSQRSSSRQTPFLERFTVADLKSWADRKIRNRSSQRAASIASAAIWRLHPLPAAGLDSRAAPRALKRQD